MHGLRRRDEPQDALVGALDQVGWIQQVLATDREVGGVAAILEAGSEKAAAHRLDLKHSTVKHHLANARSRVGVATTAQLVWILAPRLPEPRAECRRTSSG